MPTLNLDELTIALAVVGAVALVTLFFTVVFAFRLRKIRRDYSVLRGDGEERDVLSTVARSIKRLESFDQQLQSILQAQDEQGGLGRLALQKVGLVRYDAFDDMGGRLSFSAALLDDHGNGLVITTINGRTEARTYAKPVEALDSPHNLSDEEREAIQRAAAGDKEQPQSASLTG